MVWSRCRALCATALLWVSSYYSHRAVVYAQPLQQQTEAFTSFWQGSAEGIVFSLAYLENNQLSFVSQPYGSTTAVVRVGTREFSVSFSNSTGLYGYLHFPSAREIYNFQPGSNGFPFFQKFSIENNEWQRASGNSLSTPFQFSGSSAIRINAIHYAADTIFYGGCLNDKFMLISIKFEFLNTISWSLISDSPTVSSCLQVIAVHPSSGYLYTVGDANGTDVFGSNQPLALKFNQSSTGALLGDNTDILVSKHYMQNGSVVNAYLFGSNGDDFGSAIMLEDSDTGPFFFIGGQVNGSIAGRNPIYSGPNQFLAKLFCGNFSVQWFHLFRASNETTTESVKTISIHPVSKDVFVTGQLINDVQEISDISLAAFTSLTGRQLIIITAGSPGEDLIQQTVWSRDEISALMLASKWNGRQQVTRFNSIQSQINVSLIDAASDKLALATAGNQLLKITFDPLFDPDPFSANGFRVMIGSRQCTSLSASQIQAISATSNIISAHSVYCQTPPGIGTNLTLRAHLWGYAEASTTISYTLPNFIQLNAAVGGFFTLGRQRLSLEVSNLGPVGLESTIVYVGDQICSNIQILTNGTDRTPSMISCLTPSLPAGPYSVVLSAGGSNATDRFSVTYLPPSIQSISSRQGSIIGGKPINITIQGIQACSVSLECEFTVRFNDTAAADVQIFAAAGIIQVTSPAVAEAGSYFIEVSINGIALQIQTYNFVTPTLAAVSPSLISVDGGQWLQITGAGLGRPCINISDCSSFLQVDIGGETCANLQVNYEETIIRCLTKPGLGSNKLVTLWIDRVQYNFTGNNIISYAPPTLTSVTPAASFQNNTVITIRGSNLGYDIATVKAKLLSETGNYTLLSSAWLNSSFVRFIAPQNASLGLYQLQVLVGAEKVIWNMVHNVSSLPVAAESVWSTNAENVRQSALVTGSSAVRLPISFQLVNQITPGQGSIVLTSFSNNSALVEFTPATNFYGSLVVLFVVVDSLSGHSLPAEINFYVQLVNQPPYLSSYFDMINSFDVQSTSPLSIILQANDRENGTKLIYELHSLPAVGTLFFSNMNQINRTTSLPLTLNLQPTSQLELRYVPPPYRTNVSFLWNCKDPYNAHLPNNATVSIQVRYSPLVANSVLQTYRYAEYQNTSLLASIVNGDQFQIEITALPANGNLTFLDVGDIFVLLTRPSLLPVGIARVSYKPKRFFYGQDQFQFRAFSADGVMKSSANATVMINVQFRNLAPNFTDSTITFLLVQDPSSSSSSAINPLALQLPVYDEDETTNLTVVFQGQPQRGFWYHNSNYAASLSGGDGGISMTNSTPALNGLTSFSIFSGLRLSAAYNATDANSVRAASDIFSFYMIHDNKGGARSYASVPYNAIDSLGSRSASNATFNVKIQCSNNRVNNFWRSVGDFCTVCPPGAQCSDNGEYYPVSKAGFYPTDNFQFLPCSPEIACPAGNISASIDTYQFNDKFNCADGYEGLRCGQCSPNFYRRGTMCSRCPSYRINPLLLGLLVFVGLLFVLGLVNILRKIDIGFIGILLSYWQVMAILSTFRLQWPTEVLEIFNLMSVIYLNVEVASPDCFVGENNSFTYEIKWYLTMGQPIAVMVVIFILIAAFEVSEVSMKTAQKRIQLVRQGRLRRKAVVNQQQLDTTKQNLSIMRTMQINPSKTSLNDIRSSPTLPKSPSSRSATMKTDKPKLPAPLKLKYADDANERSSRKELLSADSSNSNTSRSFSFSQAHSPEEDSAFNSPIKAHSVDRALSPLSQSKSPVLEKPPMSSHLPRPGNKGSQFLLTEWQMGESASSINIKNLDVATYGNEYKASTNTIDGEGSGSDYSYTSSSGSDDDGSSSDNGDSGGSSSTSNDSGSEFNNDSDIKDDKSEAGDQKFLVQDGAADDRNATISTLTTTPRKPNFWNIVSGDYDNRVRQRDEDAGANPTLSASLFGIFLLILKLVYINVSSRSLELFQCSHNPTTGLYYYYSEPSRICFQSWWFNLLPFAIAGICIYVIGIPGLFIALDRMRKRYLLIPRIQRTRFQMFILQATYKKRSEFYPNTEYWDVVLLLRKLAVISCQIIFTDFVALQALVLIMTYCFFLLGHVFVQPYSMKSLNFLEGVTMLSSLMVLSCGIMFLVNDFKTQGEINILGYFVLAIILLSSLLIVLMLINHMKSLYDKFMLERAQTRLQKHQRQQREKMRRIEAARKKAEHTRRMQMQAQIQEGRRISGVVIASTTSASHPSQNILVRRSTGGGSRQPENRYNSLNFNSRPSPQSSHLSIQPSLPRLSHPSSPRPSRLTISTSPPQPPPPLSPRPTRTLVFPPPSPQSPGNDTPEILLSRPKRLTRMSASSGGR